MSGSKVMTVVPVFELAAASINLIHAHHQRVQREREAAQKREQAIQNRIAAIRTENTIELPEPIIVQLPTSNSQPTSHNTSLDTLIKQLPLIQAEYQVLAAQQLLDRETVERSLQHFETALKQVNLTEAEQHLQALDNARIEALSLNKIQLPELIDYAQERLDQLRDRLPNAVSQLLQTQIDQLHLTGIPLNDPNLLAFHHTISEHEAQADRVQETANHMLNAWNNVNYNANIIGSDNGDLLLEIQTHDAESTQIRIQFEGHQIMLNGPAEESQTCALRTQEALQQFQEQGYFLQWDTLDGERVPDDWRHLYSAPTEIIPQRRSQLEQY